MSNLHDRYANQLFTLYSQTKGTRMRLSEQQSKYDKALTTFYHDLEQLAITPADSYEYLIALQNILLKRRTVKQELYQINIIERSLQASVDSIKSKRNQAVKNIADYNRTLNVNISINDVM